MILITGSEGTIGRPLRAALEKKYPGQVYCIDLHHLPRENYMRCDVSQYREVERVFLPPFNGGRWNIDYVYHLAAEFGRKNGEEYYEQLWNTNVIGTRNILEMQRKYQFKLIFFSSSEIYGECPISWYTEDIPAQYPLRQLNDYAITKWVNEQQIMNFQERYGIEAMRLRLFNAYGPGEHYTPYRSVVCLFCYLALHHLPYTVYKNYYRVFMYIDDLIPTLVNCVAKFQAGEVINIGGTEYRSVEEVSALIQHHTNSKSEITYLPEDKHNVVSKRPDITKAKKLLGHNPQVTIEEGIPKTLKWMSCPKPQATPKRLKE